MAIEGPIAKSSSELTLNDWMSQLPKELHSVPLSHLTVPGSHDSGSYALDILDGLAPDKPALQRSLLAKIFGVALCYFVKRWTKTQSIAIVDQLKAGVRYFDFRTAPKVNTEDVYFVHGLYADKIVAMCTEMNEFLSQNSKEVILIDCQHFYAMSDSQHAKLVNSMHGVFREKLCPYNSEQSVDEITLDWLWNRKYQVFIFYRDDAVQKSSQILWPGAKLPNPWANTLDEDHLVHFLTENMRKRTDDFFVTQGVLTPNNSYVVYNCASTLYSKLVLKCNETILAWLQLQNPGPTGPNVVMTDFIDWNDFAIPRRVVSMNYSLLNSQKITAV